MLDKAKDLAARSPVPSGLEHELAKQPIADYYVEPGDRLIIEPTDIDSNFRASGDQEVKVDGSIDLGQYGRIRVAGMTVEQIEAAVSDQIQAVANEREIVTVQLLESNAAQVYVLGAVGSPGAFNISGNETVLDAILMAGGLTSKASPCGIILVRPTDNCECRVVQKVCYRQITQLGDVTTNYQIQPGDRVVVSERTLREEFAFWKQSSDCPCCDRSTCLERNPASKDYRNRFVSWLSPLPMPMTRKRETSESNLRAEEDSSANPTINPIQPPVEPSNKDAPSPSDEDIFLPPALPPAKPAESGSNSLPQKAKTRLSFESSSRRE